MKSAEVKTWRIIGLVILFSGSGILAGIGMGIGFIQEYSIIIFYAMFAVSMAVGIAIAVRANLKGSKKPLKNRAAEAKEVEFQRREALRDEFLPIAHSMLTHVAAENFERTKRRASVVAEDVQAVTVQRIEDSIIAYSKDDLGPDTVLSGVHGRPVLLMSVRPEEEEGRGIEVFLGGYENDPMFFSIYHRWDALKVATEYLEKFDLLET
ncbi:MAG: hypothetical protein ACD_81C00161G0001 [uncultured bacterium]|uniref:Uncharacterized protein n=2 Tax=Candidatus Wolfeibacteriota TaxID=1752735 RepID=A0A0G1K615_9BACT|nr:MAG: hypothetical protein ACD_81C00161G0001 [uncultured bacterium]KKR12386.1 MAG: hypothetical protein UT41_C0002G0160 [Candidatus Wolfebacteria bacterium GW2011_GWC2_39_22]KKT43294.1 MAG: hypothetical protein UW32_C0002G0155 [Candidatus Wolfebacteria bacterium GW2011_GWE2_44_13]